MEEAAIQYAVRRSVLLKPREVSQTEDKDAKYKLITNIILNGLGLGKKQLLREIHNIFCFSCLLKEKWKQSVKIKMFLMIWNRNRNTVTVW